METLIRAHIISWVIPPRQWSRMTPEDPWFARWAGLSRPEPEIHPADKRACCPWWSEKRWSQYYFYLTCHDRKTDRQTEKSKVQSAPLNWNPFNPLVSLNSCLQVFPFSKYFAILDDLKKDEVNGPFTHVTTDIQTNKKCSRPAWFESGFFLPIPLNCAIY